MTAPETHGKRPAIFFDLDGVINEERGFPGVVRPEDLVLIAGAGAAVRAANEAGYIAVAVSNRAQVARGQVTFDGLRDIFERLKALLAQDGGTFDRIYFCPHYPEPTPGGVPELQIRCECRKPGALLFKRAFAELSIDRGRSLAIGDSLRDIGAARAAGIRAYGVRTGYGCRDVERYPRGVEAAPKPDRMFEDVGEAVAFCLSTGQPSEFSSDEKTTPPRLLYVVSEDWYFLSHRLPMARAARAAGFEVHVATKVNDGAAAIKREGFVLHPVPFARGRLSPRATLATIQALRRIQRRIAPAVVHRVALQPTVLGALAAIGLPGASVNAITGLGYIFISGTPKARALRALVGAALRLLIDRPRSVALVQNPDDADLLATFGVARDRIVLIPGSGVDVERLRPLPEPSGPPTVGFVGRLLDIKGVGTLIAAHHLLRTKGSGIALILAGAPDPANPSSISEHDIAAWSRESGITWLGHVTDIATVWARAHIAVLPSRGGEGLPKSLLEAAACGRPLVATDVPGCRELVLPGQTGLLVPADDAPALAAAIETLMASPDLRARFGAAARKLAVERFAIETIGRAIVDLYRRLADRTAGGAGFS